MFFNYCRRYIVAPVESILWEMLDKSYARLIVGIAYSRVVTKRSGLLVSEMSAVVENGSKGTVDFTYVRTLDALSWLSNEEVPYSQADRGLVNNYETDGYIRRVAQTVLLNQANVSSFGHSFHLVNPSALPVTFSLAILAGAQVLLSTIRLDTQVSFAVYQLHGFYFVLIAAIVLSWVLEAACEENRGAHTLEVQQSFRIAIVLFILSEFMLFVSFFWAFFHSCLNTSALTNGCFVPQGVVPFFWFRIPMLNTLILLSSGVSLTLAHGLLNGADRSYRAQVWLQVICGSIFFVQGVASNLAAAAARSILTQNASGNIFEAWNKQSPSWQDNSDNTGAVYALRYSQDHRIINATGYALKRAYGNDFYLTPTHVYPTLWVTDTVLRGFVFLFFQAFEYITSLFTVADSVYGGIFFSLTGLHGFHVFVGIMFLLAFVVFQFGGDVVLHARRNTDPNGNILAYGSTVSPLTRSSYGFNWWGHRIAFDGAAWYWHFVDVVWLFVFIVVYWYGFPVNYFVYAA